MTPATQRAVFYAICWSAVLLAAALTGRAW